MLVITKGEVGGAQTHVIELCRALNGQVRFTAAIGGTDDHSFLGEALNALGVHVITLPSLRNSLNPLQIAISIQGLLQQIRAYKPHLIHVHSAVAGVVARVAGKISQTPVVYTVHGFGFKPQAARFIRWNAWFAEASMAAWTTRMICVSEYEKTLSAQLPMDPDRVSVIRNAIGETPWKSQVTQTPASITMVARLAAPKRPDLLIRALGVLASQGMQPPTRLLGAGPEQAAMQQLVNELHLPHIDIAGDVHNIAQQLSDHQIFVLLSDHEGLPMSILEAMRAGMAILATRLPGITELIEDEEQGLLVDNDPNAIAQQLARLLQDPQLRLQLGQKARARYEAEFKPEAMASKVLDIYREAPLLRTASMPMTRPSPHKKQLASQQAHRQRSHLVWSFLGLMMIGLAYLISQGLEYSGLATQVFSHTVLACAIPYALAAHLLYRGAHIPAAERTSLLFVTTGLPYLLTPLFFALTQQAYSRGAIALTYSLTMLWFWLADRWFQRHRPIKLVYIDDTIPAQMQTLLTADGANPTQRLQLIAWPTHWTGPTHAPACEGAVIDPQATASKTRSHILTQLKLNHIRLYSPEALFESMTGRLSQTTLSNELWQTDGNPAYDLFKRILDFSIVLILMPMWYPLGLLVALAVKIDSPGPAIYSQIRTGLHGKPFRIYKFRSMRFEPLAQAQFAQKDDPRITRLGHFIRKTRLDEIPQLWNILRGDMSLIGPRPEQEKFVHQFAEQIPSYPYRHLVRPGLTGWAQVQQGYAASADETVIKLSYDLYYVTHYSLAMDLLIVLKTIKTVLTGHGAR
ncbi:MAG: exopolysaccharide biosynthesis polyprenyl glycosylphosphotransferase [Limnohabitans sp.]